MKHQEVTVIIPFLNAEKTIEKCALSLLNQTYPRERTKLMFVDNSSSDQSVKKLKLLLSTHKNAQIIHCSKPGSYAARNHGLKQTNSEIIAFTDSDCVIHPKWIETLLRNYSSKKVGGVGGKLLPLWLEGQPDFYATYHWLAGVYEQSLRYEAGYIQTANASYRKEVLDQLKGYDEFFRSGGDADIAWRVADAGYEVLYDPEAIIYHHPRRSVKSLVRLFIQYGKGTAELELVHPDRGMMTDVNLLRTQLRRFWKMFTHSVFRSYRKYILPTIGLEALRVLAYLNGYFSIKVGPKRKKIS